MGQGAAAAQAPAAPPTVAQPVAIDESAPSQGAKEAKENEAQQQQKTATDLRRLGETEIPSLLYTPEESDKIRRALDIYERSKLPVAAAPIESQKEEEDFLSKLAKGLEAPTLPGAAPQPVQKPPFTFPTFYLESLMVHSEHEWVVWLSGRKYSTLKPSQDDLEVRAVLPNAVSFAWKPTDMEQVVKAWESATQRAPSVTIDKEAGIVTFNLGMNQTFYPQRMQIEEGKQPPPPPKPAPEMDASVKPADGTPGAKPEGAPAAAPAAPGAKPEGAAPPGAEGLQGLQNVYNGRIQDNLKQVK